MRIIKKLVIIIALLSVFLLVFSCNENKKKILKIENLNEYSKKQFNNTELNCFYDSYYIYYSNYKYNKKKYIRDFYFVGKQTNIEEIIFHAEFKILNNKVYCIVVDKIGNEIKKYHAQVI